MDEKEFNKEIEEAKERVEEFDKVDGFKVRRLSVILEALKCGIKIPKSKSHFEAYFMLEDLLFDPRFGGCWEDLK